MNAIFNALFNVEYALVEYSREHVVIVILPFWEFPNFVAKCGWFMGCRHIKLAWRSAY